ncbi:MAG TPA: FecR family protein [Terriglobales bacterium]|nr:FecR family protein [Terriglobales bacterium]
MSKRSLGTWLAMSSGLFLALAVSSAFAESHVRIVRLSEVQGTVQVDRGSGQGYEKAFLNMPVVQDMKVATKGDGRAEVEFEDGSTLRLTSDTTVAFSTLSLQDSGARVSNLTLLQGLAYVDYAAKHKDDTFTLAFQNEKIQPKEAARFRVDLEDTNAAVAVFNGEVKINGPSGEVELSKSRTATFDFAAEDKYTIAKNIEQNPFDAWDKQQSKYQREYASKGSYNDYPYGYGVSDLNYYGNYYNIPGYGMMWQPYFAGAGWDPFAYGSWKFYPGFGYTWVSGYPWGWMPFRYGSWNFVPGYGWMWAPGGFGTWYPVPVLTNPPQRYKPPVPPASGTATVTVRQPTATSSVPRRLTIANGSAGIGVPRGSVNNLARFSHEALQNGSVTVHPSAPVRSGMAMPGPSTGVGPVSTGASHTNTGAPRTSTGGRVSLGGHTSAPHR